MNRTLVFGWVFAACLLSACQGQQNLRPASSGNVFELEREAYEAYTRGDWQAAERAYRDLTRQVPREVDPWFRLGNVYAHLDQPDQALAAYKEALLRDPQNSKAWHNMGVVQLRQATNSFLSLEQVAAPDDPLRQRAEQMLDMVDRLLEEDFGGNVDDDVN